MDKYGASEDHPLNVLRQVAVQSTVRILILDRFMDKENWEMLISFWVSHSQACSRVAEAIRRDERVE